jgi:hypothetical protein
MQEREATHWCKTPLACLALLFVLVLGCRTPQPNLKPPKEKETLNVPPDTAHYNDPAWPEKVVARDDTQKPKNNDPMGAMGAKGPGGMGAGGMNGVGGMSPNSASMQGAGGR